MQISRQSAIALAIWTLALVPSASMPADLVSAGPFERIYDPSAGEEKKWYINDHCFVYGPDGTWHLFGITHAEPMNPLDEKNFAHATAESLTQKPWHRQPFALTAQREKWNEHHLWAPHVIRYEDIYYMYYCAGDKDHTRYKIHLATSRDLENWKRHPDNPMVVDGYDARDPFVLQDRDRWIMYYTATSEPPGGNHVVASVTSKDLVNWLDKKVVFIDPEKGTYGGPTESPFVVRRGDSYYLFIGPRDIYRRTAVYRSKDPFHWTPENRVGTIDSHAAELVRDIDGRWYVSHCGWGQGGVYLAPLIWRDDLDESDTSLPAPK